MGTGIPPLFGLGYRTPTFQDTGEEFAVIRGDLRRSNYTKTVFGRDSARTPSPESMLGKRYKTLGLLCLVSFPKHAKFAGRLACPQTLTRLYFSC